MSNRKVLWREGPFWSGATSEGSEAADIAFLREGVEALDAPYLEVQFSQRIEKVKQRWPLLNYNLSVLQAVTKFAERNTES
ncbi:hypothetical protein CWE15_03670 [Aliidiomarina taiwanensis]|uniref:Uncharacterized protein n=1 Tax=Aliidiomarina taiwanensis TaxID=946228 RepID=A0A432XA96_9GAMM|nr:hypothetical protein [Aliidiomarina taiwanensis]RUO44279.1 hypothetical protein CWE15_03670 [Aliidiomarina taiwanensis]